MPATSGVAVPFQSLRIVGTVGANAPIKRVIEKAAQTFALGVPVQIDTATGAIQACPAIVSAATALVYGVSCDYGANLATTGKPQTQNQQGRPPNQPQAVFIAVGAWPNDGKTGVIQALAENIFKGKLGSSVDDTLAVVANADLGKLYGVSQDPTTLNWFVDKSVSTAAAGGCVQITDLVDPVGTLHGYVGFVFVAAAQQVY
jgi:hypothetical protein